MGQDMIETTTKFKGLAAQSKAKAIGQNKISSTNQRPLWKLNSQGTSGSFFQQTFAQMFRHSSVRLSWGSWHLYEHLSLKNLQVQDWKVISSQVMVS